MENEHVFSTRKVVESLGEVIKAEPIKSSRSGESVRNQYSLKYENGYVFQSYDSIVGIESRGKYYFSEKFDVSRTTRKHCKWWSGMDSDEIRIGIANGSLGMLDTFKME